MKLLTKICIPTDRGNDAVTDGTLEKVVRETADRWRPEALYFCAVDGERTAFAVIDLPDATEIPRFAEPLFQRLGARVDFYPVMNRDELGEGLAKLTQE